MKFVYLFLALFILFILSFIYIPVEENIKIQESTTITKISPVTITIQDGKFIESGGVPVHSETFYGGNN